MIWTKLPPNLKLEGCRSVFTSHLQIKFLNLISSSKALCKCSTFPCKQSPPETIWTMAALMWPRITFFPESYILNGQVKLLPFLWCGQYFSISCRLHSRRPLLWWLENVVINDWNIWGWQFNNRVSSIHLNGCFYQPSECGWVSSQLLHIATPWGQFLVCLYTFHF